LPHLPQVWKTPSVGDRQLHERNAGVAGELPERVGSVQLALVLRVAQVVALG
jgi:hypothetical protein